MAEKVEKVGKQTLTVRAKTKQGVAVMDLRQIVLKPAKFVIALGHGLQARVLHGQVAKLLRPAGQLGIGEQPPNLFITVGQLF